MKRFYKAVFIHAHPEGGFTLKLDDKPLKTPAKALLVVPTRALADLIRDEWQQAGEKIDLTQMPITRLTATAQDYVQHNRQQYQQALREFLTTDSLCYLPEAVRKPHQHQIEQLFNTFATQTGISLKFQVGFATQTTDADTLLSYLNNQDAYRLTGLNAAAGITKSLVLAWLLAKGDISAQTAADLGFLEEIHQADRWGYEPEFKARLEEGRTQLAVLAAYFQALASG